VRIDAHAPHNYVNESSKPVRMLVLIDSSMIAFFREIGTTEPQATPDLALIGAAMQRHGIKAPQILTATCRSHLTRAVRPTWHA
jgi:hypothetical protein